MDGYFVCVLALLKLYVMLANTYSAGALFQEGNVAAFQW